MNVFILDEDKRKSVIYHPDKHIVKMPLEATQLLCSVLHYTGEAPDWIYRPTHTKHPCALWAMESLDNWLWLQDYTILMGYEYTYRYHKLHKSVLLAKVLPRPTIESKGMTPFVKCVPDEFKSMPVVEAYRQYFIEYKQHIKSYTNREIPYWWE